MREHLRTARNWFGEKADSLHARLWLIALSFTESSVFFVPPDPLLVAMVIVHRDKWVLYGVLTSVASVAGGVFGYVVGALLFETVGVRLIDFYGLQQQMSEAAQLIDESVFVFTLTAAFTPIPFKVAVLAAGFAKANFLAFFIAAIGGRFARYFLVAYITKVFGDNAEHIMRRFWLYATLAGVLILGAYALYVYFA